MSERKKTGIETWRARRRQKRAIEAADRFVAAIPALVDEINAAMEWWEGGGLTVRIEADTPIYTPTGAPTGYAISLAKSLAASLQPPAEQQS